MAFIISKKTKRRGKELTLYYMVRNFREGKRLRRQTICSLGEGKNIAEADTLLQEKVTKLKESLNSYISKFKSQCTFGEAMDNPNILERHLPRYAFKIILKEIENIRKVEEKIRKIYEAEKLLRL